MKDITHILEKSGSERYRNIAEKCFTIPQVDAALREISTIRQNTTSPIFRRVDMQVIDSLLDKRLELTNIPF